jgi:hypothetical protein
MSAFSKFEPNGAPRNSIFFSPMFCFSIVAALFIALFLELYKFAHAQNIWLDETTQLSGITLSPWEMLRWLSGVNADRFGVPADRMPPVSYTVDWLWLRLAGSSVIGFRLFHSAFVIAGAGVLAAIALRSKGPLASIITLTFLVLSPKLVQVGVEIRAYPIFFAVTCLQVALFLKLAADPVKVDARFVALLSLACLVASYTHFYGVVSSCAFFCVLVAIYFRNSAHASLIVLAIAIGITLILYLGITPIAVHAINLSQSSQPVLVDADINEHYYTQIVEYIFKLVGDAANMVSRSAAVLFLGGAFSLLCAASLASFSRLRRGKPRPFDWLLPVIIAGVIPPIVGGFIIKGFRPLNPVYSVWLLAPLALQVGLGATSLTGFRLWDHAGRFLAVGAMVTGAAISTYLFLKDSALFVHGPQRFVSTLYDEGAGPKAIVYPYENGAAWKFSYFPLVFSHKGEISQYRADDEGTHLTQIRIGNAAPQPVVQELKSAVAPYRRLLLVNVQLRNYQEIRRCLDRIDSCPQFAPTATERMLSKTGRWRQIDVQRSLGFYDTEVRVFARM